MQRFEDADKINAPSNGTSRTGRAVTGHRQSVFQVDRGDTVIPSFSRRSRRSRALEAGTCLDKRGETYGDEKYLRPLIFPLLLDGVHKRGIHDLIPPASPAPSAAAPPLHASPSATLLGAFVVFFFVIDVNLANWDGADPRVARRANGFWSYHALARRTRFVAAAKGNRRWAEKSTSMGWRRRFPASRAQRCAR
ncbi:hypothetical protein KCP70_10380 [Salmonella enterica subsp. enterica]|nr:hypothetical protein KCP70_10380 [Salmonella enterica subsp. enterica]